MLTFLKRIFSPPQYDDGLERYDALIFYRILLTVAVSVIILMLLAFLPAFPSGPNQIGRFAVLFLVVVSWFFLYRDQRRTGAVIFLTGISLILAAMEIISTHIELVVMVCFQVLTLLAALLLGKRGLFTAGGLIILFLWGEYFLSVNGMVPGRTGDYASIDLIAQLTVSEAVTCLFINWILSRSAEFREIARTEVEDKLATRESFEQLANQLALLHSVRTAISNQQEVPDLIRNVVELISQTYGYALVSVYLLEGESLHLQHQIGYSTTIDEIPINRGVIGEVVRKKKAVLVPDVTEVEDFLGAIEGIKSEVCVPLFDSGEVVGALNVESVSDITLNETDLDLMMALGEYVSLAIERARLVSNLTEREMRYRMTSEMATDFSYELRRVEGVFRAAWVSDSFEHITGYALEDIKGFIETLVANREDAESLQNNAARLAEGTGFEMEFQIKNRAGEIRWLYTRIHPIWDEAHQEVIGALGVARDITQQVLDDLALKESEHRYRTLFEQTNDAVFLIDTGQIIREANSRAGDMIGLPVDEIIGRPSNEFIVPVEREEGDTRFTEVMEGKRVPFYERRFQRPDGSEFVAEMNVSLVRDLHGEPQFLQSIMRDISDRKEAQQRLSEERNLLQTLIDAIPDGIYAKDAEGKFVVANRRVLDYYNIEKNEGIAGKSDYDFHESAAAEVWDAEERRIVQTGEALVNKEERGVNAEGPFWTLTTKVPWRNQEGDVIGTVGVTRDVTDLKQAEQSLRDSEYRYRALFEQSHDLILINGLDNNRVAVNKRVEEVTGYSVQEIMDMPMNALVTPAQREDSARMTNRLMGGETLEPYERIWRTKDGREITLELSVAMVRDEHGNPLFSQSIGRDITQRKQVEAEREGLLERLQRRNTQVETAIDVARSAITLLDEEHLNQAAVDLIAERFSLYHVGLFLLDDDGRAARLKAGSGALGRELAKRGHAWSLDEKSNVSWCITQREVRLVNDLSDDMIFQRVDILPETKAEIALPLITKGEVLGALVVECSEVNAFSPQDVAVFRLLTDQLATAIENARLYQGLEQRVQERTAQLEAANNELGSFAYTVSHDLRAPLRAIDGFSTLLQDEYADVLQGEAQEYFNRIRRNIQQMNALIEGLLQFSRLGRQELRTQQIELSQLVEDVLEDFQSEIKQRKIKIVSSDLPVVVADPLLMQQVYANLIGNAIKFTGDSKKPLIEIGAQQEGERTVFYVRDNGIGFDIQYHDKIFGVFERLHGVQDFEGTGVGLAIVKRIVERHGGLVWAESAVDQGATFYFTLA